MTRVKTATITWISYKNFGTYLQAYALQQALKKNGYDNSIISDQCIVDQIIKEQLKPKNVRTFLSFYLSPLKRLFVTKDVNRENSDSCYNLFAEKYLRIDYNWKSFEDLDKNYDAFVCGSDQIWAPIVTFNAFYYLGFTSKPKIAYAPSIGTFYYPEEKVAEVRPYLQKFTALSIREEQGTEIVRKQFGLECQTVLDPTLLLDKTEWETLVNQKEKSEGKYILCYLLTYNEVYLNRVKAFAEDKKLPIKIFITDKRTIDYADIPLYVGPQEFITEIKNAEYFFTDSFHGTVFAIHFEKQFYSFKRFKDDAANNQNSRIVNLFNKLKITDHFLGEEDLSMINFSEKIDYTSVKELLSIEQGKSITYLTNSLSTVSYD